MEFVRVINNALPIELCKDIIDKFETDSRKKPGTVNIDIVNRDIKKSTDLRITNFDDWRQLRSYVAQYLMKALQVYFKEIENNVFRGLDLNIISGIFGKNIIPSGFQIQKYNSTGKFEWHTDDAHDSKRLLAYIMYLNTVPVENGGSTDFLNGKSIQPKEGSVLIFPATWSYIHRGNVIKSGEKYIITGFIVQSNLKICDKSST
jgi:hypothetical protein